MKNPLSFYKKLKKLIEEEKPKNCMICFDTGACQIFVVKSSATFYDDSEKESGTSWHGVLTSVNEPKINTGYDKKSVVGEGIDVEMAAVQY